MVSSTEADDASTDGAKIFLSYSRKDRESAQTIAEALRAREFGVFRDTDDILPTEEWRDRLKQLIEEADTVVFLLSPHSAASQVCAWEVDYAYELNKRIAPIVIEDVEGDAIPPLLARLNFIFCTRRDPFENAVETLVSALNNDIGWIREHTRLLGLARRWTDAGEPDRLLLRGQDIADAEAWRDSRPKDAPAVTPGQARFVAEGRRAATRRQRIALAGSAVVSVLLLGLALFSFQQSREVARRAAILAAGAAREISAAGDPDGALMVLLNSADAFDDADAPHAVRLAFDAVLQRALAETRHAVPEDAVLLDGELGFVLYSASRGTLTDIGPDGTPYEFARLPGPLVAAGPVGTELVAATGTPDGVSITRYRKQEGLWIVAGQLSAAVPDLSSEHSDGLVHRDGLVELFGPDASIFVDSASGKVQPQAGQGDDQDMMLRDCLARQADAGSLADEIRTLIANVEYSAMQAICAARDNAVLFTLFEVPNAGAIRKSYIIEEGYMRPPLTTVMQDQVAGDIRVRTDPAEGWTFVDFADPNERTLRLHFGHALETEPPQEFAFEGRILGLRFLAGDRIALLLDDRASARGRLVILEAGTQAAYRPPRTVNGSAAQGDFDALARDPDGSLSYAGDYEVTSVVRLPDPEMVVLKLHVGMSQVEAWMYSLAAEESWRRLGRNHNFVGVAVRPDGTILIRDHAGTHAFDGLHSLSEAVTAAKSALPPVCQPEKARESQCWPAGYGG